MLRKIREAFLVLLGMSFLSTAFAFPLVIDARDRPVQVAIPTVVNGCTLYMTSLPPRVILSKGGIAAVHLDAPLARELVYKNECISGSTAKYSVEYSLYDYSNPTLLIAKVKTTYTVPFTETPKGRVPSKIVLTKSIEKGPKSVPDYENVVEISCNDPQDVARCPRATSLPHEYQYNPFDFVAFKYFPYTVVVHPY